VTPLDDKVHVYSETYIVSRAVNNLALQSIFRVYIIRYWRL